MIDLFGTPYTDKLHVVERYRLRDYDDVKDAIERNMKEKGLGRAESREAGLLKGDERRFCDGGVRWKAAVAADLRARLTQKRHPRRGTGRRTRLWLLASGAPPPDRWLARGWTKSRAPIQPSAASIRR